MKPATLRADSGAREYPALNAAAIVSRKFEGWQGRRIQINTLPAYRKMKMRPGGPARSSTTPNLLPRRYPLALLYLDFRKVEVEREQSLPVIEYHAISFEVQRARQQNDSRISGGNRCTGGTP